MQSRPRPHRDPVDLLEAAGKLIILLRHLVIGEASQILPAALAAGGQRTVSGLKDPHGSSHQYSGLVLPNANAIKTFQQASHVNVMRRAISRRQPSELVAASISGTVTGAVSPTVAPQGRRHKGAH